MKDEEDLLQIVLDVFRAGAQPPQGAVQVVEFRLEGIDGGRSFRRPIAGLWESERRRSGLLRRLPVAGGNCHWKMTPRSPPNVRLTGGTRHTSRWFRST